MDNWISVDAELPIINWIDKWEAEHNISIRVIVFLKDDERGFWFGQYHYNQHYPHWTIEGYNRFAQERITHWHYLIKPNVI